MAIPFLPKHKVKISKSKLEFVDLDATINENHDFDTVVTEQPIEAGANISDHVRVVPAKLSISGIVSNHPVSLTQINLNPHRAEDALDTLLGYQEDAELLTVDTTLRTYENMLLKRVRVTRGVDTSNIVSMDLDFQELLTVGSLFAAVEPAKTNVKSAQQKKTQGKKPTRAGRVSVLRGLVKSATGV